MNNLTYNSKLQNYIYDTLFYVKIIFYYKLDFKCTYLLVISISLSLHISTNKIQRRL